MGVREFFSSVTIEPTSFLFLMSYAMIDVTRQEFLYQVRYVSITISARLSV
jgi:hypothetical protein